MRSLDYPRVTALVLAAMALSLGACRNVAGYGSAPDAASPPDAIVDGAPRDIPQSDVSVPSDGVTPPQDAPSDAPAAPDLAIADLAIADLAIADLAIADLTIAPDSSPDSSPDSATPLSPSGVCSNDRWCWEHPRPWGNRLLAIAKTSTGWVGVGEAGLVVFKDASGYRAETLPAGHGRPALYAVWVEDVTQNVYVAGEGGAVYWRINGIWGSIGKSSLGKLYGIARGDQKIWVGGEKGAFFRLDGDPNWIPNTSLNNTKVSALWSDATGNILFATDKGLNRWKALTSSTASLVCPFMTGCSPLQQIAVHGSSSAAGGTSAYSIDSAGCIYDIYTSCAAVYRTGGLAPTHVVATAYKTAKAIGKGRHCHRTAANGWSCQALTATSPPEVAAFGADNQGTPLVASDRGTLYTLASSGTLQIVAGREDVSRDVLVGSAIAGNTLWLMANSGTSLQRDVTGTLLPRTLGLTANAIAFDSATHGFVATEAGRIFEGAPPSFTQTAHIDSTGRPFRAIAVNNGDVWIGGGNSGPMLLRRRPGEGSFHALAISNASAGATLKGNITGIYYDSTRSWTYVVTDAGYIGWYNNTEKLVNITYVPSAAWRDVAGVNGHLVVVGGTSSAAMIGEHAAGATTWTSLGPAVLPLYAVAANAKGDFVAVGKQGTILSKKSKGMWVSQESGVRDDLHAVGVQGGEFYAAGARGVVLRRTP